MEYICTDCGHIFYECERKIWSDDRGEFWGSPCSQDESGCPLCGGGYEKAKKCICCGGAFLEDDLYDGICKECAEEQITYENALEFMIEYNRLAEFILNVYFSSEFKIDYVSDKLKDELRQIYLRKKTEDLIFSNNRFFNAIKEYILCEKFGNGFDDFAEFIANKIKKEGVK